VSANALANPNLIGIGQQLLISSGTPAAPVAAAPVAAAPVATPPAAAPPAVAVPTHTVAAGDTLASIAYRHGTTVEVIAAANGITDPSMIYIGTVLQLSASPVVPVPETVPSAPVHTVAAGESLAGVAAQYGTTVDAIVTANGIPDPNLISVGQELQVQPGVSAWTCPVAGAHYFNDWGFPRSGGRFHTGNDLFAPTGTPVVAPVSGTIDFLEGPVGGLQYRLYGDDGVTYIGSHLGTLIGTDGYITAGSQLGTVGSTGNAAGSRPHLHFETKPADGPAVNPYPTLQSNGC
jgi:LysM repeat protein